MIEKKEEGGQGTNVFSQTGNAKGKTVYIKKFYPENSKSIAQTTPSQTHSGSQSHPHQPCHFNVRACTDPSFNAVN